MAKSNSSFGRFAGTCPSCKNKDAQGRGKCPKCGAFAKSDGSAWFKKGITEPVEPVTGPPVVPMLEPVKLPVKTSTGSPSVSPSKKRSPSNGKKKPVKSPSKARVEPVTEPVREPVRARQSSLDIFDIF